MNGIETILQRLSDDAKTEADAVLEEARQEAAAVSARWKTAAEQETAALTARYEKAAAEREERLVSAARMEARKTVLAAKQALLDEVYARALDELLDLPDDRRIETLSALLVQASPQGQGEVLFSARDRETVGQAAVDAANHRTGGALTMSPETADIRGGFLLRRDSVEVNCAFETLLRLQKAETAGLAARQLFE